MQFLSIPSQSHTSFQSRNHIQTTSLISLLHSSDLKYHFDTAADTLPILFSHSTLFGIYIRNQDSIWNHGGERIHQVSTSWLLAKARVCLGSSTCFTYHITSCLVDLHNHNESDFCWTWSSDFDRLDCTYNVCQIPNEQRIISSVSVIDSIPQLCFLSTFLCSVAVEVGRLRGCW